MHGPAQKRVVQSRPCACSPRAGAGTSFKPSVGHGGKMYAWTSWRHVGIELNPTVQRSVGSSIGYSAVTTVSRSIDRRHMRCMHGQLATDFFCLVFFRARIDHHHSRVVVKYKMVRRHRRRRLDGSLCDWTCRRQRAGQKKRRGTDRRDVCCCCVLFLIL